MRVLALSSLLFLAGCSLYEDRVLEVEDAQSFKVVEFPAGQGERRLVVSGLAFMSAMSVKEIELRDYGGVEVNVLVHLTQSRKGLSGSFSRSIPIKPGVCLVTFGSMRVPVWSE